MLKSNQKIIEKYFKNEFLITDKNLWIYNQLLNASINSKIENQFLEINWKKIPLNSISLSNFENKSNLKLIIEIIINELKHFEELKKLLDYKKNSKKSEKHKI